MNQIKRSNVILVGCRSQSWIWSAKLFSSVPTADRWISNRAFRPPKQDRYSCNRWWHREGHTPHQVAGRLFPNSDL